MAQKKEVEMFFQKLQQYVDEANQDEFLKVLQEFRQWIEQCNEQEKNEVLTNAIPKLQTIAAQINDKKNLLEDILYDQVQKNNANDHYGKY